MTDIEWPTEDYLQQKQHRISFLRDLWALDAQNEENSTAKYDSYFKYLAHQLRQYHVEDEWQGDPDNRRLTVSTYGGLMRLINFVKKRTHIKQSQIVEEMGRQPRPAEFTNCERHIKVDNPTDEEAVRAIELAFKAWTMVSLNACSAGEPPYEWHENESLNDMLTKYLPVPRRNIRMPMKQHSLSQSQQYAHEGGGTGGGNTGLGRADTLGRRWEDAGSTDRDREFEGLFNFHDMNRLSGFQIRWTNNFLSHLRIRKVRHRGFAFTIFVYVFHHATVLPAIAASGPEYQREYAREILSTLGLLIPSDPECLEWFERCCGKEIDPAAGDQIQSSRFVDDYNMWRSSLLSIEREFDNAAPGNLRQWWRDRRRRRDWFPFWIAVVVLVLTVLSLILSTISTAAGVVSALEAVAARKNQCNCK